MRKPSADAVFLGALLLTVVALSSPAWTGDYIYDDWLMRDSDKMDGWDDALAVFVRSSADYLGRHPASHVGAVTYRPLSMLSLIATQVTFPGAPLPHHLLSLALHLLSTWLLFGTLRALSSSRVAQPLALIFALHPLGIEAYGWINGRSDALAALGVLLVAAALFPLPARPRPWQLGAGVLLAAFSKETGLVAVVGLLSVSLLPDGRADRVTWRARVRAAAPGWACVVASVLARSLALGDVRRTGLSLLSLPHLARASLRLAGLTLQALCVPLPRTMDNLGFALAQPLGLAALLLLLLVLGLWLALAARGFVRAALLLATGMAMVLPSVFVRHTFWLGGDRYLYIPLALFVLALALTPVSARLTALSSRAHTALLAVLGLALAPGLLGTAETYQSQSDHMLAMMRLRPSDPTGFLVGARWLAHRGQPEGAQQLLAQVPRTGLPAPLASQLATVLGELGRREEALAVVADMEVRHADDPFALLDVVSVRLDEGRVAEAERKAAPLRTRAGFCQAVRAQLESHLTTPKFAGARADEARAVLARYRCD